LNIILLRSNKPIRKRLKIALFYFKGVLNGITMSLQKRSIIKDSVTKFFVKPD
jgi:hypothetical protein